MGKGTSETTTTQLGQADTAATMAGRESGQATADAANAGPWAQGVDPLTGQAIGQYADMYNQYGDMGQQYGDLFTQASGIGMQTGLEGLGGYMNPMLEQYFSGMDPMYQQAMDEAERRAQQGATTAGSAFGQNSRYGLMAGRMMGDVQRSKLADYGRVQYGAARDAAGMLMGDRSRIGGYQGMYGGMGLNALAGQGDVTRNQALMGDYRRNVGQQQAQDEYMRRAAAQQAITGSYGRDTLSTRTSEKQGDLLGDVLSVGGMAAGALIPGAGGLLGMLGGGGGPQVTSQMAQSTQPAGVMGPTAQPNYQMWQDPWGGLQSPGG